MSFQILSFCLLVHAFDYLLGQLLVQRFTLFLICRSVLTKSTVQQECANNRDTEQANDSEKIAHDA